ncbi:MAG TPA: endonuclease/exonuclease/phosphatase family protein [Anaerolineales bacterium]|nr:endonuclease/exonuclease/phosphatase family protein [Anaerolineales bacterium]
MNYSQYSPKTVEDIIRLRRRIAQSGIPEKVTDVNLIVGTWNVQAFGGFYNGWDETKGSPKRNLRGLASIAEIIRLYDVIALQEVKRDTSGLRFLLSEFLGSDWDVLLSDVTAGDKGNTERMAFIYDTRRVRPSGLAGEIVLPPASRAGPVEQFDRTPYMASFSAGGMKFTLISAHIRYGSIPEDRLAEITAVANFTADEIQKRINETSEERNPIVLGDFNIDARGDNPLFQAFCSRGLFVPEQLNDLKTTYGTEPKFYDQIAWFMGLLDMEFTGRCGVIDFVGAVFPELSSIGMTFRASDHFPLWAEFSIDRSIVQMARVLGVDPNAPLPFVDIV